MKEGGSEFVRLINSSWRLSEVKLRPFVAVLGKAWGQCH